MGQDTIDVTILEDGTVKIETEAVSSVNHKSADDMLEAIESQLGGERKVAKRTKVPRQNAVNVQKLRG